MTHLLNPQNQEFAGALPLLQAVQSGHRPSLCGCPLPLAELVTKCWANAPNQRLSAAEVLAALPWVQGQIQQQAAVVTPALLTSGQGMGRA